MALNTPYPYNKTTNPPIEIVPGISTVPIIVNKVGSSTTLLHNIIKGNITSVSYVFNAKPGAAYPWKTLTWLVISTNDRSETIEIELQTVSNQGTWNTGTEAACIAAVTAINASL